MSIVRLLLGTLSASALLLVIRWTSAILSYRAEPPNRETILPGALEIGIGFITNFFDALGIGSFATTTSAFRLLGIVPDELIPGTLLVGHALPVLTQAVVFISVISVDPLQLASLIGASVVGGWLGAGVVAALSRRAIQIGMGGALFSAAGFMGLGMYGMFPAGGTASAFNHPALAVALAINFSLGALLTLGIGNYAPSLIAFSLLGVDPRAAFPIMMGSGAFVTAIAGIRFVGVRRFHSSAALGLTIGGIPGALVAALIVKSLPLFALRWLVLIVVAYAATTLLKAGLSRRGGDRPAAAPLV